MLAGTNHFWQIGEYFAFILLNNATLTEASLTNAKIRHITMAEEQAEKGDDDKK